MKIYIILLIAMLFFSGCGEPKDDILSINGIYLGKIVSTGREYLVMDGDCEYMQDYVGYNVDANYRVEYIACLGKDYVPSNEEIYETFTFEDDELIAEISLYNGAFNGIIVKPR